VITVLVIDSNDSIVLLLEMMLTRANYQVFSAPDGYTGLEMATLNQPGIILVDELLPVMPGAEVCQRLKSNPHTRHIPVILSTASLVQDPLTHARSAGADAVLRKPFRADDVLMLLKRLLPH
jgi:two-component system cell cycle response regulator